MRWSGPPWPGQQPDVHDHKPYDDCPEDCPTRHPEWFIPKASVTPPPVWTLPAFMQTLIRRGLVTVDPVEADTCCGMPRDDDGFCLHRPGHPAYVDVLR